MNKGSSVELNVINDFRVGDLIIVYGECDDIPRIFEIFKIDVDLEIVYYIDGENIKPVGASNIHEASVYQKIKYFFGKLIEKS